MKLREMGRKTRFGYLIGLISVLFAPAALGLDPSQRVENFRLLDHREGSQELYYFGDAKAIVLMSHRAECAAAGGDVQQFAELRRRFASAGVEFFMINAADDRDVIRADAQRQGIQAPVLMDSAQIISESMALTTAGEMLLINPDDWSLVYRGNAEVGAQALAQMLAGEMPAVQRAPVAGCEVTLAGMQQREQHKQISYANTIAPILQDNCVTCHREGGIGPWAMNEYNMVRGFAPMIREVVRTQRMPPWHADPHYGEFKNDRSLTRAETAALVHWVEAGAPRGEGPDPLALARQQYPVWSLGEPDVIVEIPAEEVPATGVVDYKYKFVENPLTADAWVRATEIIPGDRSVLHHVITRFGTLETEGPRAGKRLKRSGTGSLGGYVPGAVADVMPADTGTFLPADAAIEFQMHYTTAGKAATDVSRLGIYLYDKPPTHKMNGLVFINPRIRIPAGADNHMETNERTFDKDVLVYSYLPHAHYRGKAAEFVAHYPDGSEEKLLNVPRYDFNWQTTYELSQPRVLPAGTKVVYRSWWDNSARNPANPDPSREVPWGQQSWDEMLFGVMSYRELTPEESAEFAANRTIPVDTVGGE